MSVFSVAARLLAALVWAVLVVGSGFAQQQGAAGLDPIARFQDRIDRGEARLEFDPRWGYLPSVLEALEIPKSSQLLVFSKTSAQFRLISPSSPRALYFNDDIYVGWVRGGPFLEISVADPAGGGVFYTLQQEPAQKPRFVPDSGACLQCHESGRTLSIPGHLTRSVYPSTDGTPYFHLGTTDVDHTTEFSERFGGWYVSGTANSTHRGNATLASPSQAAEFEKGSAASTLTDATNLADRFAVEAYLTPHSDIVAHLVLAHQTQMHNYIARANIEARKALAYRDDMIRIMGEPSEDLLASVRRRIENPSEDLVRHLLLSGEALLPGPVKGPTSFAADFQRRGPRDAKGRSLRDLDLQTKLFRYPCSFLIYSEAFRELPEQVKHYVYRRLDEILTGSDESDRFSHLSSADRADIRAILLDTLPEASQYWGGS
ncbi:MAG: hypothetical protein O2968_19135 [Acidobacteria bacterium]|nr:hypothetical protein [Acidobacteriota bacterium]